MELWHVPLRLPPAELDRASGMLDESERARAACFHHPLHAQRYIASHAALRLILGRALDRSPRALSFRLGPAGRPELDTQVLHFNLAHADDHALVGISRAQAVGVDIECPGTAELDELDETVFSALERAAIAACAPQERARARLRAWVRKEALLKAAGCGLDDDVHRLSVSVGPEARILASDHPQLRTEDWHVADLPSPDAWIGAVATRGPLPDWTLREWSWAA
ncbi:4'-phosphopantetheinyl transferase family protein [Ramlibacter rhizophilus]|uniref:4'-phosphopantetheinyl transferase superfamily protein n=1 Tax=Ramlibacter rhizophilus TaxID=1781167 RepID=A0A4Z0C1C9_9BURK|nr:4'-phosphopantetheinyl transferase superfamily protein [Ramlibacter rhizophilus]TFZ04732.1 4'-phosphopantetheinyl transferase superfamily protein [Ramlibacter rhizophilus]